jgi:hypothetical protein
LTSSPFKARLLARIEKAATKSKTLQKSKQSEKVVTDRVKRKKTVMRDGAKKKCEEADMPRRQVKGQKTESWR